MTEVKTLIASVNRILIVAVLVVICTIGSAIIHLAIANGWFTASHPATEEQRETFSAEREKNATWQAPDIASIDSEDDKDLIRYGRELIMHTATYLGPRGKVRQISNGMNCQNCHLQGGTKPFGNNYGRVASKYPAFRTRSGSIEGFEKRVNDCIQRSLNGSPLDTASHEMRAMVAYLKWVGKDVSKDEQLIGLGLLDLAFLSRAADSVRGKQAFLSFCAGCHGRNGEGVKAPNGHEWSYPPLWGDYSYNTGAGLYRTSKFAAFIRANMPYGTTYENMLLSEEEAWDIAAFVNSMPRPEKKFPGDWPDISKKPIDHPFGPYADNFTESDHKYGPFQPMLIKKEK